MKSSPALKRKQITLIVLSAIDVITGILSLVFAALAIQIIAIMASGVTLIKAVKIAVQSEKAAAFVKPVAVYAVRKITRSEKMKNLFVKLKENIKNNPITIITTIVELVVCGGLGYVLLDFVDQFSWAVGWKLYALAFGAAAVIYAVLLALTVTLGYDNKAFALIRKFVKSLGGEKAAELLDAANAEVIEKAKEEQERLAAEKAAENEKAEQEAKLEAERAAKALEEQKIYEFALKREEEKKAAAEEQRRRQLINAYKLEFDAEKKNEEKSEG